MRMFRTFTCRWTLCLFLILIERTIVLAVKFRLLIAICIFWKQLVRLHFSVDAWDIDYFMFSYVKLTSNLRISYNELSSIFTNAHFARDSIYLYLVCDKNSFTQYIIPDNP